MRMIVGKYVLLIFVFLFVASSACAHAPSSSITLDIHEHSVEFKIRLPLDELGRTLKLPLISKPELATSTHFDRISSYVIQRFHMADMNGRSFACQFDSSSIGHTAKVDRISNDWLVLDGHCLASRNASTEKISLTYTAITDSIVPHSVVVYLRHDLRDSVQHVNPQVVGVLTNTLTFLDIDGSDSDWVDDFGFLFGAGMRHIASGPDHVIFLLVLLLPAPLLSRFGRWAGPKSGRQSVRTIVGVVTGFTVGHSISLALAITGVIHPPVRTIEIMIAASILFSAVHAWRPIFEGHEIEIALGFGVIHGLAFSEALSGLNLGVAHLVTIIGGFNLGIEAMQMFIILLILPPMLLLSRYRYYYWFRQAGAVFAAVVSLAWMAERGIDWPNPLAGLMEWLAPPPANVVNFLGIFSVSCLCVFMLRIRHRRHVPLAPLSNAFGSHLADGE